MTEEIPAEILVMALRFQGNIRRWSRTRKAGDLRLDVAEFLVTGSPRIEAIAKRHRVSKKRVYQAAKEVKCHLDLG